MSEYEKFCCVWVSVDIVLLLMLDFFAITTFAAVVIGSLQSPLWRYFKKGIYP